MNNGLFDLKRKAAFAAALVFVSHTFGSMPLGEVSAAVTALRADISQDTGGSGDEDVQDPPAATTTTAAITTTTTATTTTAATATTTAATTTAATTTAAASVTYVIKLGSGSSDVNEFMELAAGIIGSRNWSSFRFDGIDEASFTLSKAADINDDDIIIGKKLFRQNNSTVKNGEIVLKYDTYFSFSYEDDKAIEGIRIASPSSDGYYKAGSTVKFVPEGPYFLSGDAASLDYTVKGSFFAKKEGAFESDYDLVVSDGAGNESRTRVAAKRFSIKAKPYYIVRFNGEKQKTQEKYTFKWLDAEKVTIEKIDLQAMVVSDGSHSHRYDNLVRGTLSMSELLSNEHFKYKKDAEFSFTGIETKVRVTASFEGDEGRDDESYIVYVEKIGDDYFIRVPYLESDGYILDRYTYSGETVREFSNMYGDILANNRYVLIKSEEEGGSVSVVYKKIDKNDKQYTFAPKDYLYERSSGCYEVPGDMASAGLMDFDSAFYGSTMLYDFFSRSDKTGLRNGKYPISSEKNSFVLNTDNLNDPDFILASNILSSDGSTSLKESLEGSICFYIDRKAPTVTIKPDDAKDGKWVGEKGLDFTLDISDREDYPVSMEGELSYEKKEIKEIYDKFINAEHDDGREIASVVVGGYRFDRPAGGWDSVSSVEGYVESSALREAEAEAVQLLMDLDVKKLGSKYSSRKENYRYHRELLRSGISDLIVDVNDYFAGRIDAASSTSSKEKLARQQGVLINALKAYRNAESAQKVPDYVPVLSFDKSTGKFNINITAAGSFKKKNLDEKIAVFAIDNSNNSSYDPEHEERIWLRIDDTPPVIKDINVQTDNAGTVKKGGDTAYILKAGSSISADISDISGGSGSGIASAEWNISDEVLGGALRPEDGRYVYRVTAEELRNKNLMAKIAVRAEDIVGNTASLSSSFNVIIDTARPEAGITNASAAGSWYTERTDGGLEKKWFRGFENIRLALKASDKNPDIASGIKSLVLKVNGRATDIDLEEKGISAEALGNGSYYLSFVQEEEPDKFRAVLKSSVDGEFSLDFGEVFSVKTEGASEELGCVDIGLEAVDNAGNTSAEANEKVYVDLFAPVVESVRYGRDELISRSGGSEYVLFAHSSANVSVRVRDNGPSAGISDIKVSLIGADGNPVSADVPRRKGMDADEWIVTVPVNFKGTMELTAVDASGRTSDTVRTLGMITENGERHAQTSGLDIKLPKTDYKDKAGRPLYSSDVKAVLVAEDSFSGIREVGVSLSGAPEKVFVRDENGSFTGDDRIKWTDSFGELNLINGLTGEIVVSEEGNDQFISMRLKDNARNPEDNSGRAEGFSIDKTAPVINVAFTDGNGSADQEFRNIYKGARTAVITVREKNFDESLANVLVNGEKRTVKWDPPAPGTEDSDNAVYRAEVPFETDGTYRLTVQCKDMCGWGAEDYVSDEFIIDRTAPALNVGFDKNIENDHFYNGPVTATFRISENNFDPGRVSVSGTYNDKADNFPKPSAWTRSGSDYITTVKFDKDGEYTVRISGRDKAGNDFESYSGNFCIDSQAPKIAFEDVGKSNKEKEIRPHIRFNDVNLDKESIKIELQGANRGRSLDFGGEFRENSGGYEYVFDNIPEGAEFDDIYTIKASAKDNAENKITKDFRFSVNRYGSNFVLNDATKAISGKYISSEQDVIITEYNTDRHDGDYSVFITKDSEMTELKEGVDYEVRYSGGEDEWSEYRYVIYAKNFTADARYTVSIHSVDQAGNINISTSDKKKAELTFFIDKTKPLCIPINITENSAYKGEKHTVHLAVSDNLMLKDISVYIDGESVRAHQINDECVFNIPNSTHSQDIKIVLTDMANNQIEYNYKNILVTTSVIRIVAHKTWFKFACGGAALLLSAGAFVLGKRRKAKRFL